MTNQQGKKLHVKDYGFVVIGATVVGLSYNMFLLPAKIAAGGISGVSTILYELYGFSPALVQFIINIPIFIAGFYKLHYGYVIWWGGSRNRPWYGV